MRCDSEKVTVLVKICLFLSLNMLQTACTQMGAAAAGPAAASSSRPYVAPPKLMLFGGDGHKIYLGCLNCSEYATDSVFNEYGQSGSRYSSESIWNKYGDFGSAYSSFGVCNPYATDPPVIVDHEGNYYGVGSRSMPTILRLVVDANTWAGLRERVCS